MTALYLVLLLVAAQRLVELAYAAGNTRRLRQRGAVEVGAGHYPLFVALHGAWLGALLVAVPPDTRPHPEMLGLMAALMAARLWVMASLGPYWTTRIITLPSAPLVRHGPYRLVRHPNYLVVAAEIAVLPLAFDQVLLAMAFSVVNGALLAWRVHLEDAAISVRGTNSATG